MSTGEMSPGKTSTVLTGSTGSHCCFHWYFTKLGLFGIIKQICHASVGILMECLVRSLGRLCPRENHPPSRRHSIRIPTLAWHICIMYYSEQRSLIMWTNLVYYVMQISLNMLSCLLINWGLSIVPTGENSGNHLSHYRYCAPELFVCAPGLLYLNNSDPCTLKSSSKQYRLNL